MLVIGVFIQSVWFTVPAGEDNDILLLLLTLTVTTLEVSLPQDPVTTA